MSHIYRVRVRIEVEYGEDLLTARENSIDVSLPFNPYDDSLDELDQWNADALRECVRALAEKRRGGAHG